MWDRQYEHARWNGHQLNILSTSLGGGERLSVSEIPYADLPAIQQMGASARSIEIEVVLVGSDSLKEANALIDSITKTPSGELEHPWLGELKLTCESYSQSINTTRGVVSLNLKFIRQGQTPTLNTAVTVTAHAQASTVEALSAQAFTEDVKTMDVEQVQTIQAQFTNALNDLSRIATRLNAPFETLATINQAVNSAHSAISGIANTPANFAAQLTETINLISNAVQLEPPSTIEAIDKARNAQQLMLERLSDSPSPHFNLQMMIAAVKMNQDVVSLEKQTSFDASRHNTAQPTIMVRDLKQLSEAIDTQIDAVTAQSTMESLTLYDALYALRTTVDRQYNKVLESITAERYIKLPRMQPSLSIAHANQCREAVLLALNPSCLHPLFMHGDIGIKGDV